MKKQNRLFYRFSAWALLLMLLITVCFSRTGRAAGFSELGLSKEAYEQYLQQILEYYDYSSLVAGTSSYNDQRSDVSYGSDGYATTPSRYTEPDNTKGTYKVWIGGNEKSVLQDNTALDNDPRDFTQVLPYGSVYIDLNKIKNTADWPYPFLNNTTIIFHNNFKDDFIYAASSDTGVKIRTESGEPLPYVTNLHYGKTTNARYNNLYTIAYIGDIPNNGMKIIKSTDGKPLITIRYEDAAVLNDGTRGDLVLSYTQIIVERNATRNNKMTLQYSDNTTKTNVPGPLGLIDANMVSVNPGITTGAGDTNALRAWTGSPGLGVEIDFDVSVEVNGSPYSGTMFWSSYDLDITDRFKEAGNTSAIGKSYAEGITITDGALTYAVSPYYDHANTHSDPLGFDGTGSPDDGTANGVRFYAAKNRTDGDTYDSGFAALVSTEKTSIKWTGSRRSRDLMGTLLFNNTISYMVSHSITTEESAQGKLGDNDPTFTPDKNGVVNGGTVYLEMYDPYVLDKADARRKNPGVAVVGTGGNTKHFIEANAGYYCDYVIVDGTRINLPQDQLRFVGDTYTAGGVTFTKESDGTISFEIRNYQENHTVHANFVPYILMISKAVTGNMGNKSKNFSFILTHNSDGKISFTVDFGGTEQNVELHKNENYRFTLSHGQSVMIKKIPFETELKITEEDNAGYRTTVNDTLSNPYTFTFLGDGDIVFTNHREAPVPTGVQDGHSPLVFLLLFTAVLTGFSVLWHRRRKRGRE